MTEQGAHSEVTACSILEDRVGVFVGWAEQALEKPWKKRVAHQLRTRARRLEASLRALRPMLKKTEHKAALGLARSLRHSASEARDADVLTKRVSKRLLETHEPVRAGALGYLSGLLGARRDVATEHLFLSVETRAEELAALPGRMSVAVKSGGKVPQLREVARDGLCDVAMRFAHASEQDLMDIDLLHELRKDAKRLRYTVELFEPLMVARLASEMLARMKDIQQRLGSINDQYVMLELVREAHARADSVPVTRGLEGLRDELERDLGREHASFVRWWWDRGAAAQMLGCAHELTGDGPGAAVA